MLLIDLKIYYYQVIHAIQNSDESVRNLAVKALGLGCLASANLATTHLVLLLQVGNRNV